MAFWNIVIDVLNQLKQGKCFVSKPKGLKSDAMHVCYVKLIASTKYFKTKA